MFLRILFLTLNLFLGQIDKFYTDRWKLRKLMFTSGDKNNQKWLFSPVIISKGQASNCPINFTNSFSNTAIGIIITMESSFGPVQIKVCEFQDTKWGYPEYESIKKIAIEKSM